jgi:hypothetical protein
MVKHMYNILRALSCVVVLLASIGSIARADVLAGCPPNFVAGGGGECYWTQTVSSVASAQFTGLNNNNYEIKCWNIIVGSTGATNLIIQFGEGTPTVFTTSTTYSYQQLFATGTTVSAVTNAAANGFPIILGITGPTTIPSFINANMGPFSKIGATKSSIISGGVNNGSTTYEISTTGNYGASTNQITGVLVGLTAGTLSMTCTLYSRPG